MNIQVGIFKLRNINYSTYFYFNIGGLEPKNVDFPGPGTYATTRPWEQNDFHMKRVPFNVTGSRNDRRSFLHTGVHHVNRIIESKFRILNTFDFLQSVGIGRYNLLSPVRDETIADKRKRPKRRNIGFLSTASRFTSADGESILT